MTISALKLEAIAPHFELPMQGKGKLPNSNSSHTAGSLSPSHGMSSSRGFPCNTCDLVLESSQAQRTHMRESWHVYNLKRRMADLPPISAQTYIERAATNLVSTNNEASNTTFPTVATRTSEDDETARKINEPDHPIDGESQINHCLFCTEDSSDLDTNVEHMSREHGLFLPEIDCLSSLETIIGYLGIIINGYNECLYCGVKKQSPAGIRRHMRDKGHCMINLEREPELLEFWEFPDSEQHNSDEEGTPTTQAEEVNAAVRGDMSQGQYTLASGKIIGSKNKAREARILSRRHASTGEENPSRSITKTSVRNTDANPPSGMTQSLIETQGNTMQNRAVTTRDAVGLIGVSDQRIRSLVTLQRKTQRQQAVVQASAAWAGDKGGIHQRYYKVKMNLHDG